MFSPSSRYRKRSTYAEGSWVRYLPGLGVLLVFLGALLVLGVAVLAVSGVSAVFFGVATVLRLLLPLGHASLLGHLLLVLRHHDDRTSDGVPDPHTHTLHAS